MDSIILPYVFCLTPSRKDLLALVDGLFHSFVELISYHMHSKLLSDILALSCVREGKLLLF